MRTVIFDMDGLLIDSELRWNQSRIELFASMGMQWTEANARGALGVSTREWADLMASVSGGRLTPADAVEQMLKRMEAGYRKSVPVMPGASETIDALHGTVPLAIASGSHRRLLDAVLENTGWGVKMKQIVSADEVVHGKPEPDVYLETARRLGVPPADCVVFEDSEFGILAGLAAGMKVIAVPSKHLPPAREALAKADLVLESLLEFQPHMLERFPK